MNLLLSCLQLTTSGRGVRCRARASGRVGLYSDTEVTFKLLELKSGSFFFFVGCL